MPTPQRYSVYDDFAWIYSQDWGAEYHRQLRPVLERLVYPRLWPQARVLDLCCGTGELSAVLTARGCRVTGIDGSEEMLRYARPRVPDAKFLLADAREFCPGPFDAVLSTFDSLNHVLSLGELERIFANTRRALAPGGFFLFDMNMEECFRLIWRGTSTSVAEDHVWIMRGIYEPDGRIGRAEVTIFRLCEGGWRRSDLTIAERWYSAEEIQAGLMRAGFTRIERQAAGDLGMRGDTAIGREFYLAL